MKIENKGKEVGFGSTVDNNGFRLHVDFMLQDDDKPTLYVTDGFGNLVTFEVTLTEKGEAVLTRSTVLDDWTPDGEPRAENTTKEILWQLEENYERVLGQNRELQV